MKNYNFQSIFSKELQKYVDYKRALGYKFNTGVEECKQVDKYFCKINLDKKELTKDVVLDYCKRKDNESISTQSKRIFTIKLFAAFLVSNNFKNIYIYEYPIKQSKYNFVPYIYTDKEIQQIFKAIIDDNNFKYFVIFNLLYSCGLRIGEVLSLKIENVNIEKGYLKIINSKENNNRFVYLSDSMLGNLKKYINSSFITSYVFPNINNNPYSNNTLETYFKKILEKCNIKRREDNKGPRIHDLRHTFAVKTLDLMYEKGYEYYTTLPILSKYLGDKCITHTEYYLRLTNYNHHKVVDKADKNDYILPEVKYDR